MHSPLLALVACATLSAPLAAQGGMQKLFAIDAAAEAGFGSTVAIDGDRIVVGAPDATPPKLYVFELLGDEWTEVAQITQSDPMAEFGDVIALDGDRIVARSSLHVGSVYVYERTAAGWVDTGYLSASSPGHHYPKFGWSLALEDDTLMVGTLAYVHAGNQTGACLVYRHGTGGWTLTDELVPPNSTDPVKFGASVALDGSNALIGASKDGAGKAHFFRLVDGHWVFEQTVSHGTQYSLPGDDFGDTVALDGKWAVIGAPWHGVWPAHGDWEGGAVFLYERRPTGWFLERELVGGGDDFYRTMGLSLAMHGDLVVAGAPRHAEAYAFRIQPPPNHTNPIGGMLHVGRGYFDWKGEYGRALAVDARWVVVGAADDERGRRAGAVYVYRRQLGDPPVCCTGIGARTCDPAASHGNGWGGKIWVDGSEAAADDCLFLHAGILPFRAVGFFFMGSGDDVVSVPGQISPLCLGGPDGVLRLSDQPLDTYGDESFTQRIGTREIPGLATGIVAGSTWGFQAWYRKNATMGFTDSVRVTFR